MLHACLYTVCFVFFYTSWRFYAFSGTNLLTRCHSTSSLFSAIFVFQKSNTGNILIIGRNESQTFYFPEASRSPKMRRRGARSQDHPRVARPTPSPRHQGWGQLAHLLTLPFRLYIPLNGKNLKDGSLFLETYYKPPPSSSRDRENPGVLPGTLLERGIPAGGLLHHHGRLRSDVWVVYLGLRVHSSS
jgi:hypothetical protein